MTIKGLSRVEYISPKIVHLIFKSQYALADVFMRFSEYYESPKFRNQNFTRIAFQNWFKKQYGKDYHVAWAGFNIPSSVLTAPMFKNRSKLVKSEIQFLNFFKRFKNSKIYIIGSYEDKDDKEDQENTKDHEICHGLYYIYPEYKKEVDAEIAKYDVKPIELQLKLNGYCNEVIYDEINAYMVVNFKDLISELGKLNDKKYCKDYGKLKKSLIRLNKKYIDKMYQDMPK
jgi:hypothetical protein